MTATTGIGTAVVSLTGPLSALNTDLASATYIPTTGYNGRDTLSLSDTDTVDGLVGTGSVAITVNALPPTISAPTTMSVDENSSIALTGGKLISVGDLSGTAEQLTLSVLHGTLNFGMTAGLTVSDNNTASVTLSGPLANLTADLASLSYTPTTGYNGPDTLSLSNKDTADTLAASASVPITVNPLPPVINAPPAVSVNENGSVTFSGPNTLSVTDTAGGGNENQTLTLSVSNGTLSLPTSTGLAVTGNGTASLLLSGQALRTQYRPGQPRVSRRRPARRAPTRSFCPTRTRSTRSPRPTQRRDHRQPAAAGQWPRIGKRQREWFADIFHGQRESDQRDGRGRERRQHRDAHVRGQQRHPRADRCPPT